MAMMAKMQHAIAFNPFRTAKRIPTNSKYVGYPQKLDGRLHETHRKILFLCWLFCSHET